MINVNQITAQLAKLPDQSLQRYAMMHRDDPYIVSLALAESNRRKEIRGGAQMNAAPQPKVAEQAIQGMSAPMPEEVGIGQLPAQNIAKMAGGGIVAFGGGGEVPRYNGMGGSFVGPVMSFQQFLASIGKTPSDFANALPQEQQALREEFKTKGMGAPSAGAAPAQAASAAQAAQAARAPTMLESGIGAINRAASGLGNLAEKGLGALSKVALPMTVFEGLYNTSPEELKVLKDADLKRATQAAIKASAGPDAQGYSQTDYPMPESTAGLGALADSQAQTTGQAPAPTATTGAPGPGGKPTVPAQQDRVTELRQQFKDIMGNAGTTAAAPSTAGLPGLKPPTVEDVKKTTAAIVDAAPVLKQFDEYKNQVVTDLATREQQFLKEQAELPKYGVKEEETLKKREAELAEDKKAAGWMAVIEAGLGWMSGTSPFLLSNLGAGGQKGMASYKDSMKDFKKLQAEYDKMRADLERAKVAEARDDFKTRNDFRDKADQRRDNINKLGVQITSDIFQTNSKVAGEIWNNGMREYGATARTIFQEQGQTARANAGLQQAAGLKLLELAQPSAQEKLYTSMADPNSPAAKGVKNFAEAMGYGDKTSANLLKQYTGIAGEQQLRMLEESPDPQKRLMGMQIRQKIKELQGIGGLPTPVNVANPLP